MASDRSDSRRLSRVRDATAQRLGGAGVGHGGVRNLSNEDLLRLGGPQGTDPIRVARFYQLGDDYSLPGSGIRIDAGHHRLEEIGRRVQAGEIPADTLIEVLNSDIVPP